jgi:hypothetical protein
MAAFSETRIATAPASTPSARTGDPGHSPYAPRSARKPSDPRSGMRAHPQVTRLGHEPLQLGDVPPAHPMYCQ